MSSATASDEDRVSKYFFDLKGLCHEDFAILGQFCANALKLFPVICCYRWQEWKWIETFDPMFSKSPKKKYYG